MALYTLPKQYHSDFKNLRVKPKGNVELDLENKFTKNVTNYWGFTGPSEITDGNSTGKAIPFLFDIVSGNSGHTYLNDGSDAPPAKNNQIGTGLFYDGSNSYGMSYIKNSPGSPDLLSEQDGTILFIGLLDSTTGTQMLLGQSNSGIVPIYKYGCGLCIVEGTLFAFRSVNNITQQVSLPITAGVAIIAASFSGASVSLSYNGKAVSGICRATGQNYLFGFGLSAHNPTSNKSRAMMKGVLNNVMITHSTFTAGQLNCLTINPYQVLKPAILTGYFTAEAAPAGGDLLLTNRSIANFHGMRQ